METLTQTELMPSSELAAPMRADTLRLEAIAELAELFKEQPKTESQPAWMPHAVFFTIELA
jgi:hypothetical protein